MVMPKFLWCWLFKALTNPFGFTPASDSAHREFSKVLLIRWGGMRKRPKSTSKIRWKRIESKIM